MKNRHCPAFRFCRDDCTDCEHSIRYNRLHNKIKRLSKKLDATKKPKVLISSVPGKFPANWWFITYTNANGEADPHRPMDPEELKRIGVAVAAGAVCGVIKDKED